MLDEVLKISRSGYDVDSASDKELAFSDLWPLLPIEAEGVFEVNNTLTQPVTIYSHGLGYPAVFKVYYETDFYGNDGWYYPASEAIQDLGLSCQMDSNNLVWTGNWYSATPLYLHWKVFRRSLLTDFNAENYNLVDSEESSSSDYGLLVSREGKNVDSTDYRDFSIRSDCRQLIIDQSYHTTTPDYTMTLTHNLGYRPIYWIYYEAVSGKWETLVPSYTVRTAVTTSDIEIAIQSALWGSPAPNMAILTFKNTLNE